MSVPQTTVKRAPKCSKYQVVKAIRDNRGLLYLAAADLQVSSSTVSSYIKRWDLYPVVAEAKGIELDKAEKTLLELVDEKEPWAVKFFLSMKGYSRGYSTSQAPNGGALDQEQKPQHVDLSTLKLPTEVLKLVLEAITQLKEEQIPLAEEVSYEELTYEESGAK